VSDEQAEHGQWPPECRQDPMAPHQIGAAKKPATGISDTGAAAMASGM
jgi:hypothetical protein